jgi:uncharacterized protein (DUF952 family)
MPVTNPDDIHALRLEMRSLERQVAALARLVRRLGFDSPNATYESHFPVSTLYHITPTAYYATLPADQAYVPASYAQDGFIHCTRGADLLVLVANRHFRATPGNFLMLVIDARLLTAPLKYEVLDEAMPYPFPHIYGPLNRDAIDEVIEMPRAANGTFLAPPFQER